ncbi:hypothetical protein GCM10008967_18100 [Bacillus carboniphilus]|uniref:DUF3889 domain-containing protein n=1 Tax=Bacillus carboniphilus TaxID=86663 RepID=A0ABP3FYU2_9BACI
MKKLISILMLISLLLTGVVAPASAQPDYQKYGRIALALVKEDYPGDPVKDYKYLGRKEGQNNQVTDSFEFKVTDQGKEKAVIVDIKHDLNNQKTLDISVREKNQG